MTIAAALAALTAGEPGRARDIASAGENKDEDGWADPGYGTMDWPALRAAMREAGVSLFVAEHDKPNDVARFARRARATVASWT